MQTNSWRLAVVLLLVSGACVAEALPPRAWNAPALAPAPALVSLELFPPKVDLTGDDASQQLLVTGLMNNERQRDFTHEAVFTVVDPNIAEVTPSGRVLPRGNGTTEILAKVGEQTVSVPCTVVGIGVSQPIHFGNQVVPIFTKLGCNAGGCHGKSGGQNGFHLSLLGFEPEVDYAALVKESRGRRLFPAAPEHSLLLTKGVGSVPHGGGKRLPQDSDEYRLLVRWISAGMPWGDANAPIVSALSVHPPARVMSPGQRQQLVVLAHYTDGRVEDVTRRAQFESNEAEVAGVDEAGVVLTGQASGEAAIMVRCHSQVGVFRATVPLEGPPPTYEFPHQTLVDGPVHSKYQQLGLLPSELCSDEVFIRRVMLDICGTLPTPTEVTAFVANADPKKRETLVDALLQRPEYADFFANKWADILRVKRHGDGRRAPGTFAFHQWIRTAIAEDMPYDKFIRAIVTATGDETTHPPVVWFKELADYQSLVDDTAQVFLGLRLACANCHHHPFEKWSQDDYWGLAAFYGRVGRKNVPIQGGFAYSLPDHRLRLFVARGGAVPNKRTGQPAPIKPLDGVALDVPPGDDPRSRLVDWMVDSKNPFVARAIVNRYWAHFFGRGIVDPPDDMRVTNPATNEELLDALAQDFIASGYSFKHLIRTITRSRTYQLSSEPNERNRDDKQNFSRFQLRRFSAEVLVDAVRQVTDAPQGYGGLPTDQVAPRRAIQLPDEGFSTYFLEVFGKPMRTSACECERVNDANLAQILHLLNSQEVQQMVGRAGGRADWLAQNKEKTDAQIVEELFQWCLARKPSQKEQEAALEHFTRLGPAGRKLATENLLWALINTKEFLFVR
ncbi:MAG TPA: DUF1549 and DUF1553 domain-containing protein [Gemmatales bacterium]|nr:DUF1549 and DUF1553 domain-containing protein [Gemmatales bacterium]HMP58225.1 DUF1549 and DUF1553 domain-containing protein [Gemmatales bacterium]